MAHRRPTRFIFCLAGKLSSARGSLRRVTWWEGLVHRKVQFLKRSPSHAHSHKIYHCLSRETEVPGRSSGKKMHRIAVVSLASKFLLFEYEVCRRYATVESSVPKLSPPCQLSIAVTAVASLLLCALVRGYSGVFSLSIYTQSISVSLYSSVLGGRLLGPDLQWL